MAWAFVLEGDLEGAASTVREAIEIVSASGSNFVDSVGAAIAGLHATDGAAQRLDEQIAAARVGVAGHSLRTSRCGHAPPSATEPASTKRRWRRRPKRSTLPRAWWDPFSLHEHIEAAARSGQHDVAAATLDRLTESTAASGSDWALGMQRRCEALLADDTEADELYRQAIDHLRRTRVGPRSRAPTCSTVSGFDAANRRVDARAELQTAYDMFVSMGINAFAERGRHELLLTGATVRKRTVESSGELTAQECEVSRLALDGFTNAEIGARLFISARTVEWHLRKVFTKLGISSRRDLKRVLPTRGQPAATNAR